MHNLPSAHRTAPASLARLLPAAMLRPLLVLAIGLSCGLLVWAVQRQIGEQPVDFGWSYRAANDLLAGRDIYERPYGEDLVPYPLPAALVALPVAWLPYATAAGAFFGLSSALLAWCLLREGQLWRLLIFCSWPFAYSLCFVQWTPLLVCAAFLTPLLPLLLVKPQVVLPLLILRPPTWLGMVLLATMGLLSLLIAPGWPLTWLGQIGGYRGSSPPLLSLPLGPLLLLALLRPRDRSAWLLLAMALMPQRVVYDQLALLLVARTRRELLLLSVCSWATLPAILIFDGWTSLPGGWQTWILATLYVPALLVILARPATASPEPEPTAGAALP